jgi:branched-subunit amino acid transport protein AzlD
MIVKIIILVVMLAIVFSLFRSLFFLATETDEKSKKTVNNLSWRIGLSILLFLLIIAAGYLGLIQPHDIVPARE